MYHDTSLFIDGRWIDAADHATLAVINPATEVEIGRVAKASRVDLDHAIEAVQSGFDIWKCMPARARSDIMRLAADNLLRDAERIARLMTLEQGKPLVDARAEVTGAAEVIRWFAEECVRVQGRIIQPRREHVSQMVIKEPVGPVAALTPWNYPVSQATRKIGAALAAGCSILLKADEEAPASCAGLVKAFADAQLPPGVLNLVYGIPADISSYVIPHPTIRKVSFTGSTAVGKQLTMLAGSGMKRVTMELGGHAPAIVCADADIDFAAAMLVSHKYHNAGQVCIAPSRILVERSVLERFTEHFLRATRELRIGDGLDPATQMGPMANARRIAAMERLVADALSSGARLLCGGKRLGSRGFYFEPTVLANVPIDAAIMNEEPFGPIALLNPFDSLEEAIVESNRLPYGLAAYAFTRSQRSASVLATKVETGMISINDYGLAYIEVPFNGVKSSGYGSEGGSEAVEEFLSTKFVSQWNI